MSYYIYRTVNLGRGSAANKRYIKLKVMVPLTYTLLRKDNSHAMRWQIQDWWRSSRSKPTLEWKLHMYAAEWKALSRGLRLLGPEGRSMYAWLNAHSIRVYKEVSRGDAP